MVISKKQLKTAIMDNYQKFDMCTWMMPTNSCALDDSITNIESVDRVCIGGMAMVLSGTHNYKSSYFDLAQKALRISGAVASRLFSTVCWPEHLAEAYWRADTMGDRKRCAEIACEVIDLVLE